MSSFTNEIKVKPLGNGKFELLESFEYYYAVGKNKTESIVAPKGSVTDFASIPWVFHWFIKPTNKYIMKPSIIHDIIFGDTETFKDWTRFDADFLWLTMLKIQKAPAWILYGTYIPLRMFSWIFWRKRSA